MKNLIALSFALACFCASAQKMRHGNLAAKSSATTAPSSTYTFLTYTAPYQTFTGISVTQGLKWDESEFAIPMGFNFKLYGKQNDTIWLSGGSAVSFDNINTSNSIAAASPIYEDLCDRAWDATASNEGDAGGISDVSYTVTGTVGKRICKIQVSDAGFYGEIDSAGTSFSLLNFQIWLYETSNVLEFHYGNMDIYYPYVNLGNGPSGFVCGLADITSVSPFSGSGNMLTGAPANPTMIGFDTSNPFSDAVGMQMPLGTVYQFNNTSFISTGIAQNSGIDISVFPNPANNVLHIGGFAGAIDTAELYDLNGKRVHVQQGAGDINVSGLEAGFYQLVLKNAGEGTVYKSKVIVSR